MKGKDGDKNQKMKICFWYMESDLKGEKGTQISDFIDSKGVN